jgi:hypothetical protein
MVGKKNKFKKYYKCIVKYFQSCYDLYVNKNIFIGVLTPKPECTCKTNGLTSWQATEKSVFKKEVTLFSLLLFSFIIYLINSCISFDNCIAFSSASFKLSPLTPE